MRKQGFTLVEILVIISIIALLMGILVPVAGRVREMAEVTAVNMELRQIGLALEVYFENTGEYPPTQADCGTGSLSDHLYQMPTVLIKGNYLPAADKTEAMSSTMQDRFHREHTYKYRSAGEVIYDRDKIDKYLFAKLWIPDNFPEKSSIDDDKGRWYPTDDEIGRFEKCTSSYTLQSPVSWVVFSLGPKFDEEYLREKIGMESRYPISKELWYSPKKREGFIVRMRLKKGEQIGSFAP